MSPYTDNCNKGMLDFGGKPILKRQIDLIRKVNPSKIIIIKGYQADDINFRNITYYINKNYDKTNMVESLMAAKREFTSDVIVSYGDIIYDYNLLKSMISSKYDFTVAVDFNWKKYWEMRYGSIKKDIESLKIKDGKIVQLGTPNPSIKDIDARYIGLLKFSYRGLSIIKDIYYSSDKWKTAYMTDLLQEIINRGYDVTPMGFSGGWIEFDTKEDYENNLDWLRRNVLDEQLHLRI
jgi:choline kinase